MLVIVVPAQFSHTRFTFSSLLTRQSSKRSISSECHAERVTSTPEATGMYAKTLQARTVRNFRQHRTKHVWTGRKCWQVFGVVCASMCCDDG